MAAIDMKSVLEKAKKAIATDAFQKKIEQRVDSVMSGGGGSSSNPSDAAKRFIEVLQAEIQSHAGMSVSGGGLGSTAVASLTQLTHGTPVKAGHNSYQISVSFANNLRRDSLYQSGYPDGVENIAVLLNAGYDADKRVYGAWHGEKIPSLQHRDGAHFIESAIRAFMANDAKNYGVIDIEVDDVYK